MRLKVTKFLRIFNKKLCELRLIFAWRDIEKLVYCFLLHFFHSKQGRFPLFIVLFYFCISFRFSYFSQKFFELKTKFKGSFLTETNLKLPKMECRIAVIMVFIGFNLVCGFDKDSSVTKTE
jgi:hypothetical protein